MMKEIKRSTIEKLVEEQLFKNLDKYIDEDYLNELRENLDEAVELYLNPSKDGYSYNYSKLVEGVVNKLTGQKLWLYPLAESWDFLIIDGETKKMVGIAYIDGIAPYLGFEKLVRVVEETLKVLGYKVLTEEKQTNRR